MPFPSKILLFGEYIVLLHAKALAIPFPHFFAQLKISHTAEEYGMKISNLAFHEFFRYIKETIGRTGLTGRFDMDTFESDIVHGLYFDSNIPIGYGIGSSGALTAAVYEKYVRKPKNSDLSQKYMAETRKDMAYLESFFHGNSSGIDPLVSYFKQPILLGDKITLLNQSFYPDDSYAIFLIDTGTARKTDNLVQQFLSNCKDSTYMASVQQMVSYSNTCVNAIIEDHRDLFFQHLSDLSTVQYSLFRSILQPTLLTFWKQGFQSGNYFVKLCGSGGGGFLLAFVKNDEAFLNAAKQSKLSVLHIDSH